jgi:hypothetical protein
VTGEGLLCISRVMSCSDCREAIGGVGEGIVRDGQGRIYRAPHLHGGRAVA